MVEEEVYRQLEKELNEEKSRLKRKLCDADFESVESLKGLDLASSEESGLDLSSSGGESITDYNKYVASTVAAGSVARSAPNAFARVPPQSAYSGHARYGIYGERNRPPHKKFEASRPREIVGGDSSGRQRSISLTQGPNREYLDIPQQQQKPKKLPTVFKWERGGKSVAISGSYDNWKTKTPLAKSHGDFYTIIDLPEGTHQYKFYVDGQWVCDPSEPTVDNGMGSENNVMTVRASDFEVFEALATDSQSTGHSKTGVSHSPPGEYGHNIPPRSQGLGYHSGPPILPPHLLQVILNKEIPEHCEPTLLPEPNHVMLNHLYALSIKDGVMVLSSTHRYRKKYVTTLLYKPIS